MFNAVKKIAALLVICMVLGCGMGIAEEPGAVEEAAVEIETVATEEKHEEAPAVSAPEATQTPAATEAPEVTATPEAVQSPETVETVAPAATAFNASFDIRLEGEAVIGEKVTLRVVVNGCTDGASLQWQVRAAGGAWTNVSGEHGETYSFVLNAENVNYEYRVEVTVA